MIQPLLPHALADLALTLYLLVYFPLDGLRRSRTKRHAQPALPALRAYWRQGRYALLLAALLVLVSWLEGHSFTQLGLALPPNRAGSWGLLITLTLLISLHVWGKKAESKLTEEQRRAQEAKLRGLPFTMPRTRVEIMVYLLTMIGMTTLWEVLFRGYLLLVLTPLIGLPLAVGCAALAYGAGHGYDNLKQFLGSIAAALAFTTGYALTGSLWWLIVLHAAAPVTMYLAVRKLKLTELAP